MIKPEQFLKGGYHRINSGIIIRVGYISKKFIVADYCYWKASGKKKRDVIFKLKEIWDIQDHTQEDINQMQKDCPEWFDSEM